MAMRGGGLDDTTDFKEALDVVDLEIPNASQQGHLEHEPVHDAFVGAHRN
jgi:hypothetical protein